MRRSKLVAGAAVLIVCGAAWGQADPTLVAHYTFDDTFGSVVPETFTETEHGGVSFVPGMCGKAAAFDGIDDWILIEHAGALSFDPDDASYTVSAWVFFEDNDANHEFVNNRYENGATGATSYALQAQTGPSDRMVGYQYWGDTINVTCIAETAAWPYAGKWTHLALVYDRDTERLIMYVDGVIAQVCVRPTPIEFTPTSTGNTTVGAGFYKTGGLSNHLKGAMDELRFYSRALSPTEIKAQAGNVCYADCDADGDIDVFDFLCFQNEAANGCP